MRHTLILALVLAALAEAPPTRAVSLGACGNGRGALDLAVNPKTGSVVTVGMERIGIWSGSGKVDFERIELAYGGDALTAPEGDRFAIRQGKVVHLYDFTTFRKIGKQSFKELKDQQIWAYEWRAGRDEILIVGAVVKSSMFDIKTSSKPNLVRIDVGTGTGTLIPLQIEGDFRTAAFDPAGERVALGFADGSIEIRSSRDGSMLTRYTVYQPSAWGGLGMAFHPRRNVLASAGDNKLVYYDLDVGSAEAVHSGVQGGPFLRFVEDGQYLLLGNQSTLTFADLEGRALETRTASGEHYYGQIRLAGPLQKVYSLGSDLVCWHTFQKWQKIAETKAKNAATSQALQQLRTGQEVTYRDKSLSHYINQLDNADFAARISAFQALQSIGPAAEAAVPALIRVLEGYEPARKAGEPSLAHFAVAALGAMGAAAEPAVPLVAAALASEDAGQRRAAVQCLLKLGPSASAAVPQLTQTVRDPVIDIQMAAVQALGEIGPQARAALPALNSLRKEDPRMKAMATMTIEKIEKN